MKIIAKLLARKLHQLEPEALDDISFVNDEDDDIHDEHDFDSDQKSSEPNVNKCEPLQSLQHSMDRKGTAGGVLPSVHHEDPAKGFQPSGNKWDPAVCLRIPKIVLVGTDGESKTPPLFMLSSTDHVIAANIAIHVSKNPRKEIDALVIEEIWFKIPKMHLLRHFSDAILIFRSLWQYSTNTGQIVNIENIKEGYR